MTLPPEPAGCLRRAAAWCTDVGLLFMPTAWLAHALFGRRPEMAMAQWRALRTDVEARAWAAAPDGLDYTGFLLQLWNDTVLRAELHSLAALLSMSVLGTALVFALLSGVWHAGFEAGPWAATPGQRWLGIGIRDATTGARITPRTALRRHLAGAVSWAGLNLGHAWACLAPDHATWHDRLSGTRMWRIRVPSSRN